MIGWRTTAATLGGKQFDDGLLTARLETLGIYRVC